MNPFDDFRHSLIEAVSIEGEQIDIELSLLIWQGQSASYSKQVHLILKGCQSLDDFQNLNSSMYPIELVDVRISRGKMFDVVLPFERQENVLRTQCKSVHYT